MGLFDDDQKGLDPVSMDYCVDIAMVIDVTGSMSPIIEEVKKNARAFCDKFHEAMNDNGKNVEALRIRVISYRDFKYDGAKALEQSEFFSLPEESDKLDDYVSTLRAAGGGDEPENGLEALVEAMRSDWTSSGSKRRHVILVFTDASALPLMDAERTRSSSYPKDMPSDFEELSLMWNGGSQELGGMPDVRSKRLVLFAPNVSPWSDMQSWNNVWTAYSKAGAGLEEFDIGMAINLLVNSVG